MAEGFRATEHIAHSPEAVWACLTDWRRAPEWMNGIEQMQAIGAEPVGEGTRLAFRARGAARESTIVAWSPPRRLILRSTQGGITATYAYTLEPEDGGTRLTLSARCEARGLGWRLASPLIRHLMKRSDSGQVAALKRLVEARGDRPETT